jgi:hypothetical protein
MDERQPTVEERSPADRLRWLRWLGQQMTPNVGTLLLVAILILTQPVWARPLASPAVPGPSATTVNYQGRLADSRGDPLDGTYSLTFALYDAPTGGNRVWGPESHATVPVSDGLFSVGLGSHTAGGIPTAAWNGDRYLEVTVGSETLMPRELIRSVPIAGIALTVPDGALTPASIMAVAEEAVDTTDRSTTSSSFVNFGSTVLDFTLPYRALVYVYLRGALRNGDDQCRLTLRIDGHDHPNGTSRPIYLEVIRTHWQTMGTGAILTLDAGSHTIRPSFASYGGTTAWAGQVAYGYIVLGQAP